MLYGWQWVYKKQEKKQPGHIRSSHKTLNLSNYNMVILSVRKASFFFKVWHSCDGKT